MNLLIQIVLDSSTRYVAIKDTYISGKAYYYRGDLVEAFSVRESLPNIFYGVEDSEPVTLSLADSRGDSWYDIVAAEEIRGRQIIVLEEDETFIASGIITGYTLDAGIQLKIELRNHEIFEKLLPSKTVTTDEFTDTARDVGSPIPIVLGRSKNVPLANIQNYKSETSQSTAGTSGTTLVDSTAPFTAADVGRYVCNMHNLTSPIARTYSLIVSVDSDSQVTLADAIMTEGDYYGVHCFDYLVGYGTIESLWVDHAHGYGVKRDGVLVNTDDYTFDDGSGSPTDHGYSGYATVRFWREQTDFGGAYYQIHSDIKGLELGGSEADRNFANCIKALLNNSTFGLNQSVNSSSFTTAATSLSTTYFLCDGYIYDQREARDILNELLFACRSRLYLNTSGEWEISVDGTGSSVATFGDNDGYWNNCEVQSVTVNDSSRALKKVSVRYDSNSSFEISLDVRSDFGVDQVYDVAFVNELVTAKKVLSYLYGRAYYADKQVTFLSDSEAKSLSPGDVITITSSRHDLSEDLYRVVSITKGLADYKVECEAYSSSIFADQSISDPTDDTSVLEAHDLQSIETGYIGGMLITGTAIATEDGLVGFSSAVTGGTDWRIWAGHTTPGSAPFRVDETGAMWATNATISGTITASAGTIGGFSIGSTTLTASGFILDSANQKLSLGSGNDIIIADADDSTYRLWVGNATAASATFRVTKGGALTATGATVSGTITATAGAIGGWTIDAESIYCGSKANIDTYSSSGLTIHYRAGSGSINAVNFYINSSGAMHVKSGYVDAGGDFILSGGGSSNPSLIRIKDGSASSGEGQLRFEYSGASANYWSIMK